MTHKNENAEFFAKLLVSWGCRTFVNKLDPKNPDSGDSNVYVTDDEKDMISKIIWKRTEKYGLKLPIECAYILSIGSGGNPGIAIIMYYTLLEKIVKRYGEPLPHDYIITPDDFSMAFPMAFPDMTDPSQKEEWEKAWDSQKDEHGLNNVDKVAYWDKLFV